MNLLDRNNNAAILLAGIISLIIGIGIARFSFTTLLPFMLDDFLSLTFAGILASVNYAGYLTGSIFSIFIRDINAKIKYFRIGIVLCIITTLFLGISTHDVVWLISRFVAGFGASMILVVGSAIVMTKLHFSDKTKAMGIHFSGLGLSILITDIICRIVLSQEADWQTSWIVLTLFGTICAVYCVYILSNNSPKKQAVPIYKFDKSIFSGFVLLLILAYFTEGVGMVVQATFLPDIINSLDGLSGYGGVTWTAVGIAGIPSCIIWMRLAHRFDSINVIIFAMSLQVIGILIPALTSNIYLIILSSLLYGGTFVGLVALFMNLGGKLAGKNPVILMGSLTTAYGIGQVLAPLYSVALTDYYKSYDYALMVTATIVFSGVIVLLFARKMNLPKDDNSLHF
ncbi:MAG: MFS transporter [Alphaproteobacteria bacterium]|nr:MAG: MFS transporter [Alphaproteobacteria bacterium]